MRSVDAGGTPALQGVVSGNIVAATLISAGAGETPALQGVVDLSSYLGRSSQSSRDDSI